jgi:hypothetical protein
VTESHKIALRLVSSSAHVASTPFCHSHIMQTCSMIVAHGSRLGAGGAVAQQLARLCKVINDRWWSEQLLHAGGIGEPRLQVRVAVGVRVKRVSECIWGVHGRSSSKCGAAASSSSSLNIQLGVGHGGRAATRPRPV